MSKVWVYTFYLIIGSSNSKYTTHLEKMNCIFQSCIAISEQGANFTLTEKSLDFAALLLGFNKGMYFM
jgi:hypothetical protein